MNSSFMEENFALHVHTCQTGKFVLRTQYLACAGMYVVFNLSHAVGNKQRIHSLLNITWLQFNDRYTFSVVTILIFVFVWKISPLKFGKILEVRLEQ